MLYIKSKSTLEQRAGIFSTVICYWTSHCAATEGNIWQFHSKTVRDNTSQANICITVIIGRMLMLLDKLSSGIGPTHSSRRVCLQLHWATLKPCECPAAHIWSCHYDPCTIVGNAFFCWRQLLHKYLFYQAGCCAMMRLKLKPFNLRLKYIILLSELIPSHTDT